MVINSILRRLLASYCKWRMLVVPNSRVKSQLVYSSGIRYLMAREFQGFWVTLNSDAWSLRLDLQHNSESFRCKSVQRTSQQLQIWKETMKPNGVYVLATLIRYLETIMQIKYWIRNKCSQIIYNLPNGWYKRVDVLSLIKRIRSEQFSQIKKKPRNKLLKEDLGRTFYTLQP